MTRTLSTFAAALAFGLVSSACNVAGTAVRETGDAAADTTRAAGEAAETAVDGAADVVEETTEAAGDGMRD